MPEQRCDVVVIGGGPAGLTAARVAATAGADVVVLERARHPRYKTCGGGLISTSLAALPIAAPVRDRIDRVEITLRGRRCLTRTADGVGLLSMVNRSELDAALCEAAEAAGAQVRQNATVRALGQDGGAVRVRLADGSTVLARTGIGADGSSGVTARHVGVVFDQVDLGLEVELPVDGVRQERWRHGPPGLGTDPRLVRLGLSQGRRAHGRCHRRARARRADPKLPRRLRGLARA